MMIITIINIVACCSKTNKLTAKKFSLDSDLSPPHQKSCTAQEDADWDNKIYF